MSSEFENLRGIIIGLGSIGNRHMNNCVALGVGALTIVRRPESNSQFEAPEGVDVVYSLHDALSEKPDFAVICNPSHLHAQTAIQCLQANAHVLIEKPLGKELGPAEKQLAELAKKTDRICAMAYSMRYHPAYQTAQQAIKDGRIGRCLYAKAWFEGYLPDWHPWEDYRQSYAGLREQGGGVLRTLDHEMDFLNWVLGSAGSCTGLAVNTNGIGIEADDLAMYQLRHPDGIHSQVTTSFCRTPQSRGFEFVGTQGVLAFSMELSQLILTSRKIEKKTTLALLKDYIVNDMYVGLLGDFLSSISNGRPSPSLPRLNAGLDCLKLFRSIGEHI